MRATWTDGYQFEVETRGHKIVVDQPKPVGEDKGMMPVDLLSASLATCVGAYVVDYLKRNELNAQGLTVDISSTGARNPNRVGAFQIQVNIPTTLNDRQRVSVERLAKSCTVHHTLEHPPEVQIDIVEKD
mgnify:CR=1 FL=1